jgi:hypothetical protein
MSDAVTRALMRVENALRVVGKDVESAKGEMRLIAPRLDTLIAEVREAARLVHRQGNMVQILTLEASDLGEAKTAFEEALKDFRGDKAARELEFERTQNAFDSALALVDGRVQQMRDDMRDALAAAEEATAEEEASGVIDKPRT